MPSCAEQVSRRMLACKPHWRELPAELRREINASYHDKSPTGPSRHRNALREAFRWYLQQTDEP